MRKRVRLVLIVCLPALSLAPLYRESHAVIVGVNAYENGPPRPDACGLPLFLD